VKTKTSSKIKALEARRGSQNEIAGQILAAVGLRGQCESQEYTEPRAGQVMPVVKPRKLKK
jgi:hypothetical protein